MQSPDIQLLAQGLEHHRAGRLQQAEAIYRQILQQRPDEPEALNLLGVIALQVGRPDVAVQLLLKSVQKSPGFGSLNNLGESLRYLGRLDEAIASYRRSLQMNPNHADAMANMGLAYFQQSKLPESIEAFERALRMGPPRADWHDHLGCSHFQAGDPYRAAGEHRKAIAMAPNYAPAHANLALALSKISGSIDEAIAEARKAVELAPNSAEAHAALGHVLEKSDSLENATAEFQRAVALDPSNVEHYGQCAFALERIGKTDEAIALLNDAATKLKPDPRVHSALSGLHRLRRDYPAALKSADESLKLAPNFGEGHGHRALALLSMGDYENGFVEYEWRWRCNSFTSIARSFDRPLWDGSDPRGRTILIHTEQGFGDTLQFLRYVPMLAERGASVIVEANYSLIKLAARVKGVARVVSAGLGLPDFDLHAPLLSLPRAFATTLDTVPRDVPYLFAEPDRVAAWQRKFSESGNKKRVGIIWAGNAKPDANRNIPARLLMPLAGVADATVQFFSLQKRDAATYTAPPPELNLIDLAPQLTDFLETAAIMSAMDLIITIDTATAHLAGGLGRPTWTLLPFAPDWRWQLDREDSPWYPTMKLFRQSKEHDWTDVIAKVADELKLFGE
ncbi:tetratricopeptide repeat protein [soil metagenome]